MEPAGHFTLTQSPGLQDYISTSIGIPLPGLRRRPYATWLLIATIGAMYLLLEVSGGSANTSTLRSLGALEPQLIAEGEYWRLFVAMFLHSGWMHLGLNCFGLFIFGQQLEIIYGYGRLIVIYLLSGLVSGVTTYALNLSLMSNAIGVGASGAIFGVLGGLVGFFLIHRNLLGSLGHRSLIGLVAFAVLNMLFGLVTPDVDNYAHIGGFVCGVVLGVVFSPRYMKTLNNLGSFSGIVDVNSLLKRWYAVPAVGIVLMAGVMVGDANVGDTPVTFIRQAERYRDESNLVAAMNQLEKAIEVDPEYGPIYFERAKVMVEQGNIAGAISDAAQAAKFGRSEAEQQMAIRLMVQLQGQR